MTLLETLYTIVLSYTLGSIPFAYLVMRLTTGKDIRQEGTGNVGAMNSFDVSGSKVIGITIGVLDALKGTAAVLIAATLFGDALFTKQLAAFFVVVGHCFPVWLKFKGGRGLATTFGATIIFVATIPISWVVMWWLAWFYSKKIHFCNISATVGILLIVPLFESIPNFIFTILLSALVLLCHRDVMKEAFK
jgi:acyl phosphate:glycerol-3-phosphate acyltransferase